jgi:hypothetical protein
VLVSYPLGLLTFGGAMILATIVSVGALVHVHDSGGALGGRAIAWWALTLALLWWAVMIPLAFALSHLTFQH